MPVKQSTSEACHKFCEDSEQCKASSFRPKTDEKCWILNSDGFASNDKIEFADGVTSYMKTDCATYNGVSDCELRSRICDCNLFVTKM